MTARLPSVDIKRNDDRQWFWRFVASNGREMARSSETYRRRIDCVRCLSALLVITAVAPLPDLGEMADGDEATLTVAGPDGIEEPRLTVRVLR